MINLITGEAGSGKSRLVCDMLCEEIEHGQRDVVLLVPEQQAVEWETRISSILPVSSNLRLEITNFTRLANTVFREYGGLSDTLLDDGTRSLITWKAMLSVSERLTTYKTSENGHGDRAIPYMLSAIDELKESGITPKSAEDALAELDGLNSSDGDGKGMFSSLVSRLSDAVNVYAAYSAILADGTIDRNDLFSKLADTLSSHPFFKGKAVFVDSFFSLTAAEEKILSLIMRQADDTTVTFTCPSDNSASDRIHFGETREYFKKVRFMAARENLPVKIIPLGENRRHSSSNELAAVEKMLFSPEELPKYDGEKKSADDVHIIKCADRYDEAEACASVILRLIREGYRYSDIAVVAHDIGLYEGTVDTVLRRHGIKCFISESSDVCASPAVRLVLAALSVASGGWQRRDIIRLIKTGMTPSPSFSDETTETDGNLARLSANLFENYTYTWNIRGRRMYTSEPWTMNPDGFRKEITDGGREVLSLVNAYRDAVIRPLDSLLSLFGDGRGVASVREIAERIVVFAEEYGVAASLSAMSDNYRAAGMPREAEHAAKSWDYVCEILDKMVAVVGDSPLNVTRFSHLFSLVASDMDKGTIPTGVDEVVLGSASGVRFDEVKCVIMLGAVEDEFPGNVTDGGTFFDDCDKVALESVGLTLSSPDTSVRLAREHFMFYRVASSATEKLYVLCPTGGVTNPSSGAVGIDKILSSLGKECVSVFGKMPLSEILYDKETALYLLSRRTDENELALLRSFAGIKEDDGVKLTAESDRLDVPKKSGERMKLSQTAIDRFVHCPFGYCCEKKIKLDPQKKADIGSSDIGTFVHYVLEKLFCTVPAEKIASGEITKEEISALTEEIIGEYTASLSENGGLGNGEYDGRIKYLLMRVSRYVYVFVEAIAEDIRQSKFVPTEFELPISAYPEDGIKATKSLSFTTDDGCTVHLDGIADRVDVYDSPDGKRYVRIVDYKTGEKKFSLDNISRGLDIQLLVYLFSVWKNGLPDKGGREILPAGAVYFAAKTKAGLSDSISDADGNRRDIIENIGHSGVLLDDENILRAMDGELSGQFAPVKVEKGSVVAAKDSFLVSAENFGEIYNTLAKALTDIADEIRSGTADAKPKKRENGTLPCLYCDYAPVCRSAKHGTE